MDERLKRLLQEDMEREADHMMEVLDRQPDKEEEDLQEDVYQSVLAQLKEYAEAEAKFEAERKAKEEAKAAARLAGDNSYLSFEERELIRLGAIYKKRKRWNRIAILIAALVCILSLGMSAAGGPDKLFEEVKRMMSGREQTRINTDSDRIEAVETVSEDEAYEKIDEVFGFYPVKLYYLPEGMKFSKFSIDDVMQNAQIIYKGKKDEMISYVIRPNYRTSSSATDMEEYLIGEKQVIVDNVVVNVKEYYEEKEKLTRWSAEFAYLDTHYSLLIVGLQEPEMKKIVENLYFS